VYVNPPGNGPVDAPYLDPAGLAAQPTVGLLYTAKNALANEACANRGGRPDLAAFYDSQAAQITNALALKNPMELYGLINNRQQRVAQLEAMSQMPMTWAQRQPLIRELNNLNADLSLLVPAYNSSRQMMGSGAADAAIQRGNPGELYGLIAQKQQRVAQLEQANQTPMTFAQRQPITQELQRLNGELSKLIPAYNAIQAQQTMPPPSVQLSAPPAGTAAPPASPAAAPPPGQAAPVMVPSSPPVAPPPLQVYGYGPGTSADKIQEYQKAAIDVATKYNVPLDENAIEDLRKSLATKLGLDPQHSDWSSIKAADAQPAAAPAP